MLFFNIQQRKGERHVEADAFQFALCFCIQLEMTTHFCKITLQVGQPGFSIFIIVSELYDLHESNFNTQ
jgi:hypothetical protein